MKITAVIMAGGKGERFWPKSRSNRPKQFLSLTEDGKTLIQLTVERLLPLVQMEDVFIVTNKNYVELVKEQLPEIPMDNIIAEPVARNTAPCIGLAAALIQQKYEDAVMMVLPSDHLISQNQVYINTLKTAVDVASEGENLVALGITPTYPETGYGYIHFGEQLDQQKFANVYHVQQFVEKPNLEKAKEYLASGQFIWNSGMFVWKASTIMKKFELYIPDTYEGLCEIQKHVGLEDYAEVLTQIFSQFKSESVDYAIMEKADNIYTIPGAFGWDDVGGWLAMDRINKVNEQGNVVVGNAITVDTKNTTIIGGKKLIATVGLENVIVVDTEDAILLCTKEATQDVKKVIEGLRQDNRVEYI